MNSNAPIASPTSYNNFWYNNSLFMMQSLFSLIGVGFSAGMLITGHDSSVYLPIFTSLIFYWAPSPINHRIPDVGVPSGVPQLRELLSSRNPNIDNLSNLGNLNNV
jgi:hypothetical protein